jgi:hypothetical protein
MKDQAEQVDDHEHDRYNNDETSGMLAAFDRTRRRVHF